MNIHKIPLLAQAHCFCIMLYIKPVCFSVPEPPLFNYVLSFKTVLTQFRLAFKQKSPEILFSFEVKV